MRDRKKKEGEVVRFEEERKKNKQTHTQRRIEN